MGAVILFSLAGCGSIEQRPMTVTAYCGCGECNNWVRGRWAFLKLNPWDRYIASGPDKGKPYDGRTASGTRLHQYHPGFFSVDTLIHPWMAPVRILFFPWIFVERAGTVAADTDYFPFGTRIYIPGYGWGVVEDRGSAIKGPNRLDVYYRFHSTTDEWGRQNVEVGIMRDE